MKKLLLLTLLFLPCFSHGQGVIGNGLWQFVWSAPSGSCSTGAQPQYVFGPGTVYTCQNGTWTLASSSGGGSGTVNNCGTIGGNAYYAATGTVVSCDASVTDGGSGTLNATIFNASTGFQIGAAAASGHYLRGSGTSYVDSTIQSGDVPTLNQNTSGSAASLSISGQTALLTFVGLTSTNRAKTVRDAADTILELGGSYTPTGTWTSMTLVTPALGTPASGVVTNLTGTGAFNTSGTAGGLSSTNFNTSGGTLTLGSAGGTAGAITLAGSTSGTVGLNCSPTTTCGTMATTAQLSVGGLKTTNNCSAAGTAASPSVVSCSAAPMGAFSCATNASGATCQVNTTAVTTNSDIQITPTASAGTRLSVTCNTTADTPTGPRIASISNGASFTINLGTVATNPTCYFYTIIN